MLFSSNQGPRYGWEGGCCFFGQQSRTGEVKEVRILVSVVGWKENSS